jgi:hypothetical protein
LMQVFVLLVDGSGILYLNQFVPVSHLKRLHSHVMPFYLWHNELEKELTERHKKSNQKYNCQFKAKKLAAKSLGIGFPVKQSVILPSFHSANLSRLDCGQSTPEDPSSFNNFESASTLPVAEDSSLIYPCDANAIPKCSSPYGPLCVDDKEVLWTCRQCTMKNSLRYDSCVMCSPHDKLVRTARGLSTKIPSHYFCDKDDAKDLDYDDAVDGSVTTLSQWSKKFQKIQVSNSKIFRQ